MGRRAPILDRVEGWKAIAEALETLLRFPITAERARHLARHKQHRLPVERIGGERRRPVVVVDHRVLVEWARTFEATGRIWRGDAVQVEKSNDSGEASE